MKINQEVKSIQIPRNMAVRGYKEEQYAGGEVRFTENQECIEDFKFSMAQVGSQLRESTLAVQNLRSKRVE